MTRMTIASMMAAAATATIVTASVSFFRPVSANWSVTEQAWLILHFFDGRVRLFWVTSEDEDIEVVSGSPAPDFRVQPRPPAGQQTTRPWGNSSPRRNDPSFLIRIGDRRAVKSFGGQWRSALRFAPNRGPAAQAGRGSGGSAGQRLFAELSYVRLPYWLVVVVLLYHPVRTIVTGPWLQRWRYKRYQCITCGYSLTGNTSGICPECGSPIVRNEDGVPNAPA